MLFCVVADPGNNLLSISGKSYGFSVEFNCFKNVSLKVIKFITDQDQAIALVEMLELNFRANNLNLWQIFYIYRWNSSKMRLPTR